MWEIGIGIAMIGITVVIHSTGVTRWFLFMESLLACLEHGNEPTGLLLALLR